MRLVSAELLARIPVPKAAKAAAIQLLCDVFASAFDVVAPKLRRIETAANGSPDTAHAGIQRPDLWAFRTFSAACMDAALESHAFSAQCIGRLYEHAFSLGTKVRRVLNPRPSELPVLVHLFYALIEIDVVCFPSGELVFNRCYFSGGYTPAQCAFMSAFDSGFVGGLHGGGRLEFSARITQGAPCCRACLVEREVL
ncbi:MAG: hypothetical protein IJ131_07185 [Eggerthellaceae bacterium]|nr:hypothetical protein [Eggerthellaceae bacterium]